MSAEIETCVVPASTTARPVVLVYWPVRNRAPLDRMPQVEAT